MTNYLIIANGMEMGTYQADTEEAAILAYVKDAGYSSIEAVADVLSKTVEDYLDGITVKEVK